MTTAGSSDDAGGRGGQIALVRRIVANLAEGQGAAHWIEGEPGIGKSTLLDLAAAEVAASGCLCYRATCDEAFAQFPFWALLEGMRPALRDGAVPMADSLAQQLANGAMGLDMGGAAGLEYQLCELVEQLCDSRPVALVLDQAESIDPGTVSVLRWLTGMVRQLPLVLLVAGRTGITRADLAGLRSEMIAVGSLVRLGPLDAGQSVAAVTGMLGAGPGPGLAELVVRAGGNPLLLRELVDALDREGLISRHGGVVDIAGNDIVLPSSLAAAVMERLSGLPERIWPAIRMATILADGFSVAELAAMLDEPVPDLAMLIEEAVAAGVFVRTQRRFEVRQGLIREALLSRIPVTLRPMLHLKAVRVLLANGAHHGRVARHVLAAVDTRDDLVLRWIRLNAPNLTYWAPQLAVDLLARASEMAGEPEANLLRVALVRALYRIGRMTDMLEIGQPMLANGTPDTVDVDLAGELTWAIGYALVRFGRTSEAVAVATRTRDQWRPSGVWNARLVAMLALAEAARGNFDVADEAAHEALRVGREVSDSVSSGYALHVLSLVVTHRDRDESGSLELIDEALGVIGSGPDDADLRVVLLGNRAATLAGLDRTDEQARAIVDALTVAERMGIPARLANLRLLAAEFYFTAGQWDNALAELGGAIETLVDNPPRLLMFHGLSALIAVLRDDRTELATHLTAAADVEGVIDDGLRGIYGTYLTAARAVAAEHDGGAGAALEQFLPAADRQAIVDNPPVVGMAWIVRLAQEAGRDDVIDDLLGLAGMLARQTPTPSKQADERHCRALVSGDGGEAVAASRMLLESGQPLHGAHAMENAAVLFARAGDVDQARDCHRAAVRQYEELAVDLGVRRADARLRVYGLRRGRSGARRRAANGWESLSPTQVRVAELIADGLSNAEIATRMLLSRRTVQTHVSHILAKLDARSRLDVAKKAHDRDTAPRHMGP